MELARLGRLSFFQGIPSWALIRLAEAATEEELPAGRLVLRQSDRARAVHFLLAGSVQVLIRVGEEDLLVGVLRRPGELVGWSAFRPPYRYTASVRCEEPSRLARVPATAFEEVFERDPALAYQILQRVATSVANRLEQTRERLCPPPSSHRWRGQAMSAETLELLAGSPFFEGFDPQDMAELAGHALMIAFQAAERVFAEAEPATALFLLVSGAVELSFATQADQEGPGLAVQTITHVGHPIGWSSMGEPCADPAARAGPGSAGAPGQGQPALRGSAHACHPRRRRRPPPRNPPAAGGAPLRRRRRRHPGPDGPEREPAPAPRGPGRARPGSALPGHPGARAPGAPDLPAAPADLRGRCRRARDDEPGGGPAAQHARVPPPVRRHSPPDRRLGAAAGTTWPHRHHEPPGQPPRQPAAQQLHPHARHPFRREHDPVRALRRGAHPGDPQVTAGRVRPPAVLRPARLRLRLLRPRRRRRRRPMQLPGGTPPVLP